LLDLTANALDKNPDLDGIAPYVDDSGEGRWTVQEAIDLNVPAPVIHPIADRAPALARQSLVLGPAAGGDAQRVRRACGEEGLRAAWGVFVPWQAIATRALGLVRQWRGPSALDRACSEPSWGCAPGWDRQGLWPIHDQSQYFSALH